MNEGLNVWMEPYATTMPRVCSAMHEVPKAERSGVPAMPPTPKAGSRGPFFRNAATGRPRDELGIDPAAKIPSGSTMRSVIVSPPAPVS